jgi:hypothetical protein
MTTLTDQALRQHASLEARGSSGSTLKASAALTLWLLAQQGYTAHAAPADKHVFSHETMGTGTAIVSLRITEQDVLAQLARVYRTLSSEQMDLDADARRVLYANLWSLY